MKIIIISLLFITNYSFSQCDSINFEKDVNIVLKFCSDSLTEKTLANEKQYYSTYFKLLELSEQLIVKYKTCDNKFFYESSSYLYAYLVGKLMTKSTYGKFQSTSSFLKHENHTLYSNIWKINRDSLNWHKKEFLYNYMRSDYYLKGIHFYNNIWPNTINGELYYKYFYNKFYLETTIPSDNYFDGTYNSFDDVETTYAKEDLKGLLYMVTILVFLIGAFLVFIVFQLRKNKKQNKLITEQKSVLEHQKQEITDSINYSKRIQTAILPDLNDIKQNLREFFILYQPKDIVSGDFYYFNKVNNDVFIAAADCTGHGVPGAFMSLVGSKELKIANAISNSPAQILKHLNNGVKDTLRQNHIDGTKDGMDIALVRINGTTVTYSAANRPLWILKKDSGIIEEIKATKTAIAGFTEDNFEFEEHEITLAKGDTIYLFSDGYADQFGGDKQKKMTTKRFREFLFSIKDKRMTEQQTALECYFHSWKGEVEQVDDLLVIGIRLL